MDMDLTPRQAKMFEKAFHCDYQVVNKNLDYIFGMLESKQEIDAFSIAWGQSPAFLRRMVVEEVRRLCPGVVDDIDSETTADKIKPYQRQVLTKCLVKVSDAGTITAGRMLAIREFMLGIKDTAWAKGVTQEEKGALVA